MSPVLEDEEENSNRRSRRGRLRGLRTLWPASNGRSVPPLWVGAGSDLSLGAPGILCPDSQPPPLPLTTFSLLTNASLTRCLVLNGPQVL